MLKQCETVEIHLGRRLFFFSKAHFFASAPLPHFIIWGNALIFFSFFSCVKLIYGREKIYFFLKRKTCMERGVFEWKIEGNFIKKKKNPVRKTIKKHLTFNRWDTIKGLDYSLFIFESWEITMKKILKDKYFLLLKKKNIYINSTQFDTWKWNVSPE